MFDTASAAAFLARISQELSLMRPMLPTYLHLLSSAVLPIFAGAHASLSRPSSAAEPKKRKRDRQHEKANEDDSEEDSDDEEDEDEDHERAMEVLGPADALWLPIFAGLTLTGLYLLIRWLEDISVLNKLLTWYFSAFGVFAVAHLLGDTLKVGISFIFPNLLNHTSPPQADQKHLESSLTVHGPESANDITKRVNVTPSGPSDTRWSPHRALNHVLKLARSVATGSLDLQVKIYSVPRVKTRFGLTDVMGLILGIGTVAIYILSDKPWVASNLLGLGLCYGALQMLSPATFWTGTLLLSALFCYDIYFVFYTPLMVTVAKSLDVPIKLLFPRPNGPDESPVSLVFAMLGLGDVVLPGMMIGLALRFDLYLFYLGKQLKRTSNSEQDRVILGDGSRGNSRIVESEYRIASGNWGERFWATADHRSLDDARTKGGLFPKPYFYASLAGYLCGMFFTLLVMQMTGHAQPALLYLVPAVLGSLWGTAWARGELQHMWEYSEGDDQSDVTTPGANVEDSAGSSQVLKGSVDNGNHIGPSRGAETDKAAGKLQSLKKNVPDGQLFSLIISKTSSQKKGRNRVRRQEIQ